MTLRWYDYAFGVFWLGVLMWNFVWGGLAAVVVFVLLCFAAYRLGKLVGR